MTVGELFALQNLESNGNNELSIFRYRNDKLKKLLKYKKDEVEVDDVNNSHQDRT